MTQQQQLQKKSNNNVMKLRMNFAARNNNNNKNKSKTICFGCLHRSIPIPWSRLVIWIEGGQNYSWGILAILSIDNTQNYPPPRVLFFNEITACSAGELYWARDMLTRHVLGRSLSTSIILYSTKYTYVATQRYYCPHSQSQTIADCV